MIDFSRKLGQLTIGRRPVASLKIGGKVVWSSPLSPQARDLANGRIEEVYRKVLFTGSPVTSEVAVYNADGLQLTEGLAYDLEWFDNVQIGTARVVATGKGMYHGQIETTFEIVTNDVSDSAYDFELDPASFPEDAGSYDARVVTAIDPTGEHMVEGVDFTTSNDQNGTVTITGIGKYVGAATRTYEIISTVDYLTFTALDDGSTLALNRVGTWTADDPAVTFEADTGTGWAAYTPGTTLTLNQNQRVRFRGTAPTDQLGVSNKKYHQFATTGRFEASGNVMTLLDHNGEGLRVGNYGFYRLFQNAAITTAPKLPATAIGERCYVYMFENCSALTTAPALPATILASNCYQFMFQYCTLLTTAPELPATTLANYCYYYMFRDCHELTAAPELPATTLASSCYNSMFYGCWKLAYVKVRFTTWNNNATQNWLEYVAKEGLFDAPDELMTEHGSSRIPDGWARTALHYLSFIAEQDGSTIGLEAVGSPAAVSLEYSVDDGVWLPYQTGMTLTRSNGQAVKFRGDNQALNSDDSYYRFAASGKWNVTGTATALLDSTGAKTDAPAYAFKGLFQNCYDIYNASGVVMPTTLAEGCFKEMFNNCTHLTAVPELKATTMAERCYEHMFAGCVELAKPPVLQANTLAVSCYKEMFKNCAKLAKVPELNATTVPSYAYASMFEGCTSIKQYIPVSATFGDHAMNKMFYSCSGLQYVADFVGTGTLAQGVLDEAFRYCTSLVRAPAIPWTTLDGIYSASYCFGNCTAMTETGVITAKPNATRGMWGFFEGCTSLSKIRVAWTTWPSSDSIESWVGNVASTGTFICPEELPDERGSYRIPSGWNKPSPDYFRATAIGDAGATVYFEGGSGWSLEYSLDGSVWSAYDKTDSGREKHVANGETIWFRAAPSNSTFDGVKFMTNGDVDLYGDVMTLLDKTGVKDTVPSQCFREFCQGATGVKRAPDYTASIVGSHAYEDMFKLSGVKRASYPPARWIMTECYRGMFSQAQDLETLDGIMPTPIYLEGGQQYSWIFEADTKIQRLDVEWTAWPSSTGMTPCYYWVLNMAQTGEFHCTTALPDKRGVNYIPEGWTVVRDVA